MVKFDLKIYLQSKFKLVYSILILLTFVLARSAYNSTTDGFLIVGCFNEFGIAEGVIDSKIGKIREIRLHVHSDSENWAILSEVSF